MSIKIALAGNPNSGKTTLFNNLTGANQYVGNWPGVTVEKKEGKLRGDKDVIIQDLPGIYSLSPYTLEEVVARNYIIDDKPDAMINIVDGTNLERNLYLSTQLMETGVPLVMAVNMMDVVRKNGDVINMEKLSKELGCPIVPIAAVKGEGAQEAAQKAAEMARNHTPGEPAHVFSGSVEHAIAHIEDILQGRVEARLMRFYAVKLFERDEKADEKLKLSADIAEKIEAVIAECEAEMDDDSQSIITNERYAYIGRLMTSCVKKKSRREHLSASDRIDRVVTNRWLALPIFAVIMAIVYIVSIGTVGALVTDFTNDTLFGGWISEGATVLLENVNAADWLIVLLVDGVIGGVGAVLGFVPQMLILFLFLSVLEDIGYMARVAFIMDRIFRKFGLSGKSFIPMLIGSGCSVPGIMASRTIENEKDRRMTIITTSFIPCGAKMPIVGLIAGALFGGAWWMALSAYFIGVAAVIISGIILKKTRAFAGDPAPFVMELPAYHAPRASGVLHTTWERGWSFIKRAGTVILVASLVIAFLANFGMTDGQFGIVEDMDTSVLASIGNVAAPVFAPLGFGSWQATVATVMGLVAKEEVVGVFGVLFGVSGDALELVDEGAFAALSPIAAHFTGLSAFSFLIFNLLCAPCFAAMGAIKREMNSGKWTCFAIAYLTVFAYAVSLIVFQLGTFFATGAFGAGTAVAIVVLAVMLWLLLRPQSTARKGEAKAEVKA